MVVAETGPAALEEFDRGGADLVLLDLMLPGISGIDVCRTLRQRSTVPIIMLTAKDSELDKVVGLEIARRLKAGSRTALQWTKYSLNNLSLIHI